MSQKVIDTITTVIAREQKCDQRKLTTTTRLSDLGIDSLRAITIIYEIEEEFGVEIPNEMIETIHTVGDIADRLQELSEIKTGR